MVLFPFDNVRVCFFPFITFSVSQWTIPSYLNLSLDNVLALTHYTNWPPAVIITTNTVRYITAHRLTEDSCLFFTLRFYMSINSSPERLIGLHRIVLYAALHRAVTTVPTYLRKRSADYEACRCEFLKGASLIDMILKI